MATEQTNSITSNAVRIREDKMERVAKVARLIAAAEDRRVSISSVVDEILNEGLSKRERKLGIA